MTGLQDNLWMIAPDALAAINPLAGPMGDRYRIVRKAGIDTSIEVDRRGSIAVVRLDGVAVRRTGYVEAIWDGYSTELLKETVDLLAADEECKAIILWTDSPGGQAHGVAAAADAIEAAAQLKPVVMQVQGGAFSAAYYLGCAATRIVAHAEDSVGSIGVVMQLFDQSEAYAAAGIKPVTFATGPLKAIGAAGEPITDEQKAHIEAHIQQIFSEFKSFVVKGRNLTPEAVDALATGGIFTAQEAVTNGLIDGIATLDETLAQLKAEIDPPSTQSTSQKAPSQKGRQTMSTPTPEPKTAASFSDLKACLPGASAEFICDCQEKGLSLDQATSTWMEKQKAENELLQKELAEAKKAPAAGSLPGVPDASVVEPGNGGVKATGGNFQEMVAAKVKSGMDRRKAVLAAADESPEAHIAFIAAHNAKHPDPQHPAGR